MEIWIWIGTVKDQTAVRINNGKRQTDVVLLYAVLLVEDQIHILFSVKDEE